MPRRQDSDDIDAYTTRALQNPAPIPPICFIPHNLRKRKVQVVRVISTEHKSAHYQQLEVLAAEPHSLLIAIQQGQPIPRIVLSTDPNGNFVATTEFTTPTLDQQMRAAEILSNRIPVPGPRNNWGRDTDPSHDSIVEKAANSNPSDTQKV